MRTHESTGCSTLEFIHSKEFARVFIIVNNTLFKHFQDHISEGDGV